jgi:hypothetical protein
MSAEVDTASYPVLVPADVKLYKKTAGHPRLGWLSLSGLVREA